MAISNKDLTYKIKVDSADAKKALDELVNSTKGLSKVTKDAENSTKSMSSSFSDLGASVVVANQALGLLRQAYSAILGPVQQSINAFAAQEQAEVNLANAMRLTGTYTKESLATFRQFATELQRTTVVGDEVTLRLLSVAKSIGVSDEMAKKFVKTAIDLSAATGISLDGAFMNLLETTKGAADSLARFAPEIRSLTKEEIINGKALDMLSKKFDGFASGQVNTTRGAIVQLENAYGDLKEEIGKLLVEKLGLVEVFKNAKTTIEQTGPALQSVASQMQSTAESFGAVIKAVDFAKLAKDAAIFAIEIGAVVLAFQYAVPLFAAMNWSAMLAGIMSVTKGLAAMRVAFLASATSAKAFIISSAGLAFTAIKFTVIAAAVDIVVRNLDQLGTLAVAVFGDITRWVVMGAKAVVDFSSNIASMLEAMGATESAEKFQKWIDGASKSMGVLIEDLDVATRKAQGKVELGFLGSVMEMAAQTSEAMDQTGFTVGAVEKSVGNLSKTMVGAQLAPNPETLQRYEAIKNSVKTLESEIDRLSLSQGDAAKAAAERSIAEINAVRSALSAEGSLSAERSAMLDKAAALTLKKKDEELKKIAEAEQKALIDANSTYAQLVGDQSLMAQTEYDKQLASYQEMLDKKLLSTEQFEAARAKLEQQRALGEAKGAGASAANFGQEGVTQAISQVGSFMQGFSDMLLGPVAAVQGVVGIAQGIVDAIPNLLSSLTSLVTSFVELPTKILDGVLGLVQAIPRLISEFIPRLLEAVPEIIFSILDMLYTAIPDAFLELFNKIPLVIEAIAEKLPVMAQALVTGLVTGLPKIALGLVNFIVNGIPKIIRALLASIPEIINALIQGLVDGVSMIGEMIMSIFTGGDFFKAFGSGVVDSVGSALKSVTGAASSLFSVSDIGAPFKAQADNLGKQIKDATRTATNWLGKAWEGMKAAGRWLDQNIWGPAWEGMKAAGRWLDQNIWGPAWEGMKAAGRWLDEKIFQPIANLGGKIWDGLVSAMNSAGNIFAKLGTWIWDGLIAGIESIGNVFSKLFQFDGGGTGTVEKFIGLDFPFVAFAQGGLVPGRSSVPGDSAKNDTVPALLSPGEIVLPRSVLGDEAFRRVVMAKLAGQEIPQFGVGGWVKSAVSGVGGAISSVGDFAGDVLSGAAGFLIPDWVQELYNSISKFIGNIDLVGLVRNPMGTIMDALAKAVDVFKPYLMQLIQPQGFATGGFVGASTDTVPAMLTPGEFVINRDAVRSLGLPTLNALNSGRMPQNGGGSSVQNVEINLTINTTQGVDAQTVKSRVLPVILEELRRASLEGRRVLSPAGVR